MPVLFAVFWIAIGIALGWSLHGSLNQNQGGMLKFTNEETISPDGFSQRLQGDETFEPPPRSSMDLTSPQKTQELGDAKQGKSISNLQLAEQFLEQGQVAQARTLVAPKLSEDSPVAWLLMAKIELLEGRNREALHAALKADHFDVDLLFTTDILKIIDDSKINLLNQFRKEKAWEEIETLLRLLINNDKLEPQNVYYLADALYHQYRYEQASVELDRILFDTQWGEKAQQLKDKILQMARLKEHAKTIVLEEVNGNYLIRVVINERYPAILIIDTGSPFTILKKGYAQTIGLSEMSQSTFTFTGISKTTVEGYKVQLDSLSLSGLVVENFEAAVGDILGKTKVDGLLGLDYLNQFSFSITPEKHLILEAP